MKLGVEDFAVFVDLGEAAPVLAEYNGKTEIVLVRNGKETKIIQHDDGKVQAIVGDTSQSYPNATALIASATFADLAKWARNQFNSLSGKHVDNSIEPKGKLFNVSDGSEEIANTVGVSDFLRSGRWHRTCILVVDGPAGIGKTTFINQLSLDRAKNFSSSFLPLILHVESRGRVLQNITDLMAFSLQSLQVPVMFFQVPLLVRLGLVTLAIDGFDELADPYGYQGAWSQLNELIQKTRGQGSLILSGRETFISTERVLSSLPSIDPRTDSVGRFSIEPMSVPDAKTWLKGSGWTSEDFSNPMMSTLFQDGSIALRPFFLSKLSDKSILSSLSETTSGDPLAFLVDLLLEREAGKFGNQFEARFGKPALKDFAQRFLEETARDLADNQTSSVPLSSLEWIAEFVAAESFNEETVRILVQRCGSMALLSVAESTNHRQFSHEQLQQHFLACNALKSLKRGEVPKFVRRNILGHEFLIIFTRQIGGVQANEVEELCDQIFRNQGQAGSGDRTRLNLVSLLVAAVCGGEVAKEYLVSDVGLDDIVFTGVVPKFSLKNATVNSVYAQGADLKNVDFFGASSIYTAFFDYATKPNINWPKPTVIEFPDKTILGEIEVTSWIDSFKPVEELYKKIAVDALDLLSRIGRYGPFWLREGDDNLDHSGKRILEHPLWSEMRPVLEESGLLEVDNSRQASGRFSSFFHFRDKSRLEKMTQAGSDDPFLRVLTQKFPR